MEAQAGDGGGAHAAAAKQVDTASGPAETASSDPWAPSSWKDRPILQQPVYEDAQHLGQVIEKLRQLPPLVHVREVDRLKQLLAEASRGERFLLQGGDCAETFAYCNDLAIQSKLKVLIQMSLVLTFGARIPLVRILRAAGQYAKPRSKPTEVVDGQEYLAYRGDNINGFSLADRKPDPDRLLQAYFHSAATWNYVRALLSGGFADLHRPQQWVLDHVRSSSTREAYEELVRRMLDALDFMKTIHAEDESSTKTMEIYSSHEGLLLPFEEALTRPVDAAWYNVGAHFLWIGDRTRQLDGAHIEYFRGLANPIGLKVGPSMQAEELTRVVQRLNPNNEPGKLTLITRYGAEKVAHHLPGHIRAIQQAGLNVVWCCDPMHGNTEVTSGGLKTRRFDNILSELRQNFDIHKQLSSHLGGVHFELTGDNVTECLGGSAEMDEQDLSFNYQTQCDPRLNYTQSLDMAFVIAKHYERERNGH